MIVRKANIVVDVDIEMTTNYAQTHSLCECDECRNFYVQAREKMPKLAEFLSEFGVPIERPDEISSIESDENMHYLFVAYTVVGEILETDKYEIDLFDGDLFLNITIDNSYVPNEQTTDKYFTIIVYNLVLPWALDD